MVCYLNIVLSIFVVTSYVSDVYCIKCFDCKSTDDPKCADPFDNSTVPITDCNKETGLSNLLLPTMCRKIKQKVNGEWHYIRNCAIVGEVGIQNNRAFCLKSTGTDNNIIEYCTCNSKDGCNSSGIISPLPVILLIPFLSVYVKISK